MKQSWWRRFKASHAHTQANIVCTFIIMAATIAYAIIAGLQLGSMNRQLKEMGGAGEQTKQLLYLYRKQLEEMKKQTLDTDAIAKTNQDALVSVQRAFVFSTPNLNMFHVPGGDPKKPDGLSAVISWMNSGDTPTRNLRVHSNHRIMKSMPANFSFPDRWRDGQPHIDPTVLLGPHSGGLNLGNAISITEVKDVAAGREHWYLWGWAKYDDVFSNKVHHITRYCIDVDIFDASDASGDNYTFRSSMCPKNNCYDEECKVQ